MELHGKTVLVIGLKRTGVSVARFVASQGGCVRVSDHQGREALASELAALANTPLELHLGTDDPALLASVDLVVPSPGVPANVPLLQAARRRRIPIWSEIELAARFLTCPIIAVTGTNGKSTTTSLLGEMLRQSGVGVFVGGNLGTPSIEATTAHYDVAVLEVSSFQLEWIEQFRPHIGLFLNLSLDHLDRHKSFAVYGMTKRALLSQQQADDWAVVNRDDPEVWALAHGLPGQVLSFGWTRPTDSDANAAPATWIEDDTMVVRRQGRETQYALNRTRLWGRHNRENMMAAVSAAALWGVSQETVAEVLTQFPGLPHRMELVANKNGVIYIDDSKGTNVGAVAQSLASCIGPVLLLAGGVDKGSNYSLLQTAVRAKVKALIVFGQARGLLRVALGSVVDTLEVDTLAQAVQAAAMRAHVGDTVLLSPACASFDQFRDYAHRGEVFRTCVEAL